MQQKVTWSHCNSCGPRTKHIVLASNKTKYNEEIDTIGAVSGFDKYEMLQCQGCESVKLKHTSWFSEDLDEAVYYYPPNISRKLPDWQSSLPLPFRSLLREVYAALHADSRQLSLMGTRAVLDLVMLGKIGDIGTFADKLKALEEKGFIGTQQHECLAAAFDAGSAAMHRGYNADVTQINQVMDIIENLLEAVYVLPGAADELKKTTPPRKVKKRKGR